MTPELAAKHGLNEYELEAEWKVRHKFKVFAKNAREAIEKLQDAEPPYDKIDGLGHMVDDTFVVTTPRLDAEVQSLLHLIF